jgi:hypothetical protein
MLIEIAKPIPLPGALNAVLMPIASPSPFTRGPPLFPGLIEASVWMKS